MSENTLKQEMEDWSYQTLLAFMPNLAEAVKKYPELEEKVKACKSSPSLPIRLAEVAPDDLETFLGELEMLNANHLINSEELISFADAVLAAFSTPPAAAAGYPIDPHNYFVMLGINGEARSLIERVIFEASNPEVRQLFTEAFEKHPAIRGCYAGGEYAYSLLNSFAGDPLTRAGLLKALNRGELSIRGLREYLRDEAYQEMPLSWALSLLATA